LQYVPDESIRYHAGHNHFSNWLKARTEFRLAERISLLKTSDYPDIEGIRRTLIASLGAYSRSQQQGLITEFDKNSFDPALSVARIGGGSLGGKARGIGFLNMLISNYEVRRRFAGVQISVPPAVVIGAEVFDQFLDRNNLRKFALESQDDAEITRRFLNGVFPEEPLGDLAAFLHMVREPLAVRSSSTLEDSHYHPFAGVYQTYMLPNDHPDRFVRLGWLIATIKRVYASTFYQCARDYFRVTEYQHEEEKMSVIIQKMAGARHGARFYPDFAGVAKSYNYYPVAPQKAGDGIVTVALGLGKTIVDGGAAVRFCPKYPEHLQRFSPADETSGGSQTQFFALDMESQPIDAAETRDVRVRSYDLRDAETDGVLSRVASTYSFENDVMYDGVSRDGLRVVTFAPILRHKIFPLSEIAELLLDMGSWGMGAPVEMEFAVNLSVPRSEPKQFSMLQMRPFGLRRESDSISIEIEDVADARLICRSERTLGHGVYGDIYNIVYVDAEKFDHSRSRETAEEIAFFNEKLVNRQQPYLLIGIGRWGSMDPWLGIPVKWDQIAGARGIVEAEFSDMDVDPSQGSHFFHNITSFRVGYFTVNSRNRDGFLDWAWLRSLHAGGEKTYTRHIRLDAPVTIKIDGHRNKGIILKPEQRSGI
jgi:hypothetical protein